MTLPLPPPLSLGLEENRAPPLMHGGRIAIPSVGDKMVHRLGLSVKLHTEVFWGRPCLYVSHDPISQVSSIIYSHMDISQTHASHEDPSPGL